MKHKIPTVHDMHPNVTPLIDIVMCLIIFYMLVAKIGVKTGADASIKLPATLVGLPISDMGNTVTLNVLDPQDGSGLPRVTTMDPRTNEIIPIPVEQTADGKRPLAVLLHKWRGKNDKFKVIVRADQGLDYKFLEPVLICAAEAKVESVNFATAIEQRVITVVAE